MSDRNFSEKIKSLFDKIKRKKKVDEGFGERGDELEKTMDLETCAEIVERDFGYEAAKELRKKENMEHPKRRKVQDENELDK